MGYASYRAFTTGTLSSATPRAVRAAHDGAFLYSAQLALNLVWMPLFFVLRRPAEATLDLVALLGVNGYLTYTWAQVDQGAAWCQLPYLAWLTFATYLSAGAGWCNNWDISEKNGSKKSVKEL